MNPMDSRPGLEASDPGVLLADEPAYPPTRYRPPPGATRVILVRHAQPVDYRPGSVRSTLAGQDDPPLSRLGREQARLLAESLVRRHVGAIYSSPLRRALETATPLAELTGLEVRVLDSLREVHLGQWEAGLVHQRIRERDPLWDEVWRRERWDAIPGAEPNERLHARVRRALDQIRAGHPQQTVTVFTHDGVIAAALALATGSRPFAFASSGHASTSDLVLTDDQGWRLRTFNDRQHLRSGGSQP